MRYIYFFYILLVFPLFLFSTNQLKKIEKLETQNQTINKCINDYNKGSLDEKKRALLIIGKYNSPLANNLLVKALHDSNSTLRLSALVSLSEKNSLPNSSKDQIVKMFLDDNIHIERIATSLIPNLSRFSGMIFFRNRGVQPFKFDKKYKEIINKALSSKDTVVKKNLLIYSNYYLSQIDSNIILECLKDKNEEIRRLAIQKAPRIAGRQKTLEFLKTIMKKEKSEDIILKYIQLLAQMLDNENISLLKKYMNSQNINLQFEATKALLKTLDKDAFIKVEKLLYADITLSKKLYLMRLFYRKNIAEQIKPLIKKLLNNENQSIRTEALKLYIYQNKNIPSQILINYLSDNSKSIRTTAMNALRISKKTNWTTLLPKLLESKYKDIRLFVLQNSNRLPKNQYKEFLLNYLIDEDESIQMLALKSYITNKFTNWEKILTRTIKFENDSLRRQTLYLIHFLPIEKQKELLNFLIKSSNDKFIREFARRILFRQRSK